jgi:hypothetical protein
MSSRSRSNRSAKKPRRLTEEESSSVDEVDQVEEEGQNESNQLSLVLDQLKEMNKRLVSLETKATAPKKKEGKITTNKNILPNKRTAANVQFEGSSSESSLSDSDLQQDNSPQRSHSNKITSPSQKDLSDIGCFRLWWKEHCYQYGKVAAKQCDSFSLLILDFLAKSKNWESTKKYIDFFLIETCTSLRQGSALESSWFTSINQQILDQANSAVLISTKKNNKAEYEQKKPSSSSSSGAIKCYKCGKPDHKRQ